MPVTASVFTEVIQDHLELKKQNAELGRRMPLDRYITDDPFENHPLFKSEEQARLEETLDGEPAVELHSARLPWPGEEARPSSPRAPALDDGLWGSLARLRLGRVAPRIRSTVASDRRAR